MGTVSDESQDQTTVEANPDDVSARAQLQFMLKSGSPGVKLGRVWSLDSY